MLKFYYILLVWFVSIVISYFLIDNNAIGIFVILLLTVSFVAAIIWGVSNIRSGMFVSSYNYNSKVSDKIALTFDDGPDIKNTSRLLDLLKEYDAKATFFLIGEKADVNRNIVKQIVANGHQIGNHSYYHKNTFPLLSLKRMKEELYLTQKVLKEITGKENGVFRPPFGVTNPTIAKAVKSLGLNVIGWNIRSFDTKGSLPKEKILSRVLKEMNPGDIILLHETSEHVFWLTINILKHIKEQNLKVVTIDSLQEI